ncbi:MAG: N-acetylmuramoyl-L-alanine amidase [Gemmatimonadota bacterium]
MIRTFRATVCLLAVAACGEADSRIPALDGTLTMDVRYPLSGTHVPAADSVAAWGSVGTGRATLRVNAVRVPIEPNGTFAVFLPAPTGAHPELRFVARRGRDSVVRVIPLARGGEGTASSSARPDVEGASRPWGRWVTMRRLPSDTADSATQWRPIYARSRPGGEVVIGIAQGIRLFADARTDRSMRLQLAPHEEVWIPMVDADSMTRRRSPTLRAGKPTIANVPGEVVIAIPLPERLPSTVELTGDRLHWTIFGAAWERAPAASDGEGTTIRRIVPRDTAAGRAVVDLGLVAIPLGWRTEWHAGALKLRVRLRTRESRTLEGLRITLDPGHPPDGTTGPSRLMEDSVTLAVAQVAAAELRARGATVTMTREGPGPLSLEARAAMAEQLSSQLFISLHLNAPGPGRPPSAVYGTQTYWMNANGRALALTLLTEVAAAMGQPAIGMYPGEYAVLRPAWAAAALVEGSGIVLPEREAFLRTPEGVAAYARGVVNGIARWQRMSASRALPAARAR